MKLFMLCVLVWAMGCDGDDEQTHALSDAGPDGGSDAGSDAGPDAAVRDEIDEDWEDDEVRRLYDEDAFETFDLRISDEDLAFLDADPTAEEYVEGSLRFDGEEYPAGIRYKASIGGWHKDGRRCVGTGGFSTMPEGEKTCPKLSMKVSFNEYDSSGRFMGLRKVLFHSLNMDPSLMRERLGYEIFRDMGLAAPRASHARLLINGEFQGVYAFIEYIDGEFTRSRWTGGEGNLYKEIWPAVNDTFVPNTEAALLEGLVTNEHDDPSFEGFLAFNEAMADAGDDEDALLEVAAQWFDLDYMMRYIAADRATEHNDGIFHFYPSLDDNNPPWSNHNFYIYESQTRDKLWVIPWDMDNAWNPNSPVTRINDAWNDKEAGCEPSVVEGFGIAQIPPSCSPVIRAFAHDSLNEAFEGYVAELLDGPLSEAVIEEKIEKWSAQIADSVEEASAFEGELSMEAWANAKDQLRSALEITRNNLREMIGREVIEADSVTMSGYVTQSRDDEALEGVQVCLYDHPEVDCVTTSASGAYELAGVPPLTEQVLTFDRDDLVPVARNYNVPEADYNEALGDATGMWLEHGELDPLISRPAEGKGSVQLFPYGNSAGHVLSLTPDPGVAPDYFAPAIEPDGPLVLDPELSATTEAGLVVIQNIEPGEYHAMFDGCMGFSAPQWGLPATDGTSAVRFKAIPGYVLNAIVQICN